MGYEITMSVKIVRKRHRITLHEGVPAISVKEMLARIPDHAVVEEVGTDPAGAYIEFHEESMVE